MADYTSALVSPARAAGGTEARGLVARDGAALLTGAAPQAEGSFDAARAVLGGEMLDLRYQFGVSLDDAAALRSLFESGNFGDIADGQFGDNTERVRRWVAFFTEFLASRPLPSQRDTLPAHVDGYGFGDHQPDYIFQTFAHQSGEGGETVLIDAARLLELVAANPETADLAAFCWSTTINHTEAGLTHFTGTIASRRPSGRLRVIRHDQQAALVSSPTAVSDGEHLARWQAIVDELVDVAPGFKVECGETLCLDNFRVLHARKPYEDEQREVHVSWAWTCDAAELPPTDELEMVTA